MASEKDAGASEMARPSDHTGDWDCCFDCRTNIVRRKYPVTAAEALGREHALMEEALGVIAHHPEYDGRFCMDREECPNCYAQGTLAAIAEARAALRGSVQSGER